MNYEPEETTLQDMIYDMSSDELWELYNSGDLTKEDAETVFQRWVEEKEVEAIIAAGR